MGGHGAWVVAAQAPDLGKLRGVVAHAGWLRKDRYAESNVVAHHDAQLHRVEPALLALLVAGEEENHAVAVNFLGIPVLIRVGAEDQTVDRYFSRRMARV